jgi:type II secretory pathway pseudopilin PulG
MKAFSLLEILIYLGIFSMMIVSAFTISSELTQIAENLQNISYIEFEGSFLEAKSFELFSVSDTTISAIQGVLVYKTSSTTAPLSSSLVTVSNFSIASSSDGETRIHFNLSMQGRSRAIS